MATIKRTLDGHGEENWLYRPDFPEHWARSDLYSLAKWVNGLAFRNIEFQPKGMPVIKIAEIKNGITEQTKFTLQEFDDSVRVSPGDMLFSWSGQPESSIDVSRWLGPEGWLNQHIFRVTVDPGVEEDFFFYLLKYLNPIFVSIARNKQTTGLGHVTKKDLEQIEIALPVPSEQQAIAHVLGTLDDKIELNRRMNRTLEEMARAIFQDWFVDFGPTRAKMEGQEPYLPPDMWDLFPNQLVDSELGEIPEAWDVRDLGEIVDQLRKNKDPRKTPTTTFSHFSIGAFDQGQTPVRQLGESIKSSKCRVLPGSVLLSKLNPNIERVWLVDVSAEEEEESICSTEFLVLSPKEPFGRYYIYCLLRSPTFTERIQALATGTSKSHQRAQVDSILKLSAVIPPRDLVRHFDALAGPILSKSLTSRKESAAISAQRDALLPKLLHGELLIESI